MNNDNILTFPSVTESRIRRDIREYADALLQRGAQPELVDALMERVQPLLEIVYAPLQIEALALLSDTPGLHQALREGIQRALVARIKEVVTERLNREADILVNEG